jgi:putative membrane protein
MWGGHWLAGPLWLLVIVVLIVVFATAVTRRRDGNRAPAAESRAALDILRERFARGEIDKAEFEDRKRVLGY